MPWAFPEKDMKECPVEKQITWKEWSAMNLDEGLDIVWALKKDNVISLRAQQISFHITQCNSFYSYRLRLC